MPWDLNAEDGDVSNNNENVRFGIAKARLLPVEDLTLVI